MNQSHELAIVTTTVANLDDAKRLANELVRANLVACVQIDGPLQSVYRWGGEVRFETEYRLTLKTRSAICISLQQELLSIHPYDEPQIVITSADASRGYRDWVVQQTT